MITSAAPDPEPSIVRLVPRALSGRGAPLPRADARQAAPLDPVRAPSSGAEPMRPPADAAAGKRKLPTGLY